MSRIRAIARLFVYCSALASVACATPRRYEAHPVDAAASARELVARGKDDAGLRAFMTDNGVDAQAFPPSRWGRREVTLLALYFHPDLDLARARVAEAEAARITAARRAPPGAAVEGEHHSRTDGGISPWTLGFNFDFTIVTAGKRAAAADQADRLAQAAWLDLAATAWTVRARAVDGHIALFAATRARELATAELDLRQAYVRVVQKRVDAGAGGRGELSVARIAADEAELARARAAQAERVARADLAGALGISEARLTEIALDFGAYSGPATVPALADLEADALVNRLEVRRALALHEAAEAALRLEVARQYPDIDLRSGFIWDQGDHRWVLGSAFPLPLPRSNAGPIAQAEARRATEARNVVALQSTILAEVDRARDRAAAVADQWLRQATLAAERSAELRRAQRRFEAGETDRLDLVAAQIEQAVAARHELEALIATHRARSAVEASLQRPLDPSEAAPVPYRDSRAPVASSR